MVTTKDGPRPYWVHLIWTFYLFMNITMFWWWEFRLSTLDWSLPIYLVVIIYATLFFFASLVVQPTNLDGISSYKEYYYANRRWFFGLIIAFTLWDIVDTTIKGVDHLLGLGTEYLAIIIGVCSACAVAIITPNERYHQIFAVVWVIYNTVFQLRTFFVIN